MTTPRLAAWKVKATVQRLCASLPLGDRVYRLLQRSVGGLRRPDPLPYVRAYGSLLDALGGSDAVQGLESVEIGTGWNVNLPLALNLCGARSCVTLDANRYCTGRTAMRDAHAFIPLLMESLRDRPDLPERIQSRWSALRTTPSGEFVTLAGITYVAPVNVGSLNLPSNSRDLVFSRATLQHIPRPVLAALFRESARVLRPGGRIWHRIDLFDQFSTFDRSLSRIHYLRYAEEEWLRIASNRYAYANRLRISDYEHLAERAGFTVSVTNARVDRKAIAYARSGRVHSDYADRDDRDLGTIAADLVGHLR